MTNNSVLRIIETTIYVMVKSLLLKLLRKWLSGVLISALIWGCSLKKYVPSGQKIYTGSTIQVISDTVAHQKVSGLKAELNDIIRPLPVKTIFGFPYKLWFYYWIGEPKNEAGVKSWFRKNLAKHRFI